MIYATDFMATEVGCYLPPYSVTTVYFLKALMRDKKRRIHVSQVRTVHIPQ